MFTTTSWTVFYGIDLLFCIWVIYGNGAEWLSRGDFRRLFIFYPFHAWLDSPQIRMCFRLLLYLHSGIFLAGLLIPELRDFLFML